MNSEEKKRFTDGLFQQIQIISDYCQDLKDKFDAILEKSNKEMSIYGMFLRNLCFLKTLKKCNQVSDVQTIVHANRTLIELVVDLIMLLHDTTGEVDKKIRAWEESAKLKAAKAVINYFKNKQIKIPSDCKAQENFIQNNETIIENQRKFHWNKTTHPDRWTNNSLEIDVKNADSLHRTNLEELYALEYRRMNWFTHGSGLTGMRNLDLEGFYNVCGLAYAACGKLGLLCAKLNLEAFGYFQFNGIYTERWNQINKNIEAHLFQFLPR